MYSAKIMSKLSAILIFFAVCLGVVLFLPQSVKADTNLVVKISDPDRPQGETQYIGNTVYTVLSNPVVTWGENRELGTLRVNGKPGIAVPVYPGNKIQISLPKGVAYMQVPSEETYKKYVEWPTTLNGKKNQVCDGNGKAGMKFIAATPSSLTLEVGNVDSSGEIMIIDFVFNQTGLSKVRMARFVEEMEDYDRNPDAKVSRWEFFKLLYGVALQSTSPSPTIIGTVENLDEKFSDIGDLHPADEYKIIELVNAGLISGYEGGLLKPQQNITRAEAVSVIGKAFKSKSGRANFIDQIPAWAEEGINSAYAAGICYGYPDGNFRPEQELSKQEATMLLQSCLEYYSYRYTGTSDRVKSV